MRHQKDLAARNFGGHLYFVAGDNYYVRILNGLEVRAVMAVMLLECMKIEHIEGSYSFAGAG